MRRLRAVLREMLPLLALASVTMASAHASGQSTEFEIKAAYLSKFGNFVSWPDAGHAATGEPVAICVLGKDPFGNALEAAVAGHTINGHPIAVRYLRAAEPEENCQILYVAETNADKADQILKAARGMAILTVTDLPEAHNTGGVINFVIKDDRVRFQIDEQAADDNHLVVSSQLLALAASVKPRMQGGNP